MAGRARIRACLHWVEIVLRVTSRCAVVLACCTGVYLLCGTRPNIVQAKAATGSIKGVVRATTQTSGTRPILLSSARVTLTNRDLPTQVLKTVTDDAGAFVFTDLPAATYLLTAEASGLPSATREIILTEGANLTVEIELTA